METTDCYLYIICDVTKPGNYIFGEYKFEYLPFYVGISSEGVIYKREDIHIKYAKIKKDVTNNKYKMNIINNILKQDKEPFIYRFYEKSDRAFIFQKEIEIIALIGNRFDGSGPLVNISKGGDGGDTFTNNPRKEEIREKHRQNAIGSNNHMYGLPLEQRPSHIAKMKNCHWNTGRKISEETRNIFKKIRKGEGNSRARKTLLFDKEFNLVKIFGCCFSIGEYIGSSSRAVSKTARTNSNKEIPYHTTKGHYVIYKDDWENKFKHKENEIKEFLKNFKKNRNQFS